MKRKLPLITLFLCCALHFEARAQDQEQPVPSSLLHAIGFARGSGPELLRIAEITGSGGQPDPKSWTIISYDAHSPTGLKEYTVRDRKTKDRGPNYTFYPKRQPDGFFLMEKVKLDSTDAFKVADKAAGEAKIGFDSISYRLRCREFTDQPVWTLKLQDAEETVVGIVDLSAETGKVLRTIWFRVDPKTEDLAVQDSAVEGHAPRSAEAPHIREQNEAIPEDAPLEDPLLKKDEPATPPPPPPGEEQPR